MARTEIKGGQASQPEPQPLMQPARAFDAPSRMRPDPLLRPASLYGFAVAQDLDRARPCDNPQPQPERFQIP